MKKAVSQLIPGVLLGHYTDLQAKTGCTVILVERGATAGVDIRGSASGTREIEPCQPEHLVEKIHAICIAGGSAFGLAAADGVMEYLEHRGVGFDVGVTRVPIVASAIIYDLGVGSPWIRPDRRAGYSAAAAAREDRVQQGPVGAGTGATIGKLFGVGCSSPGGFGFSSLQFVGGVKPARSKARKRPGPIVTIQAFVVVNSFGDVFHPQKRRIIAGARRTPTSRVFADTYTQMKRGIFRKGFLADPTLVPYEERDQRGTKQSIRREKFKHEGADTGSRFNLQNTTVAVVVTDAVFTKVQMKKIAQMTQNGLARVLRPAHTMFDGDTVFALSVPDEKHPLSADVNVVGEVAAEAVAKAIVSAVKGSARNL